MSSSSSAVVSHGSSVGAVGGCEDSEVPTPDSDNPGLASPSSDREGLSSRRGDSTFASLVANRQPSQSISPRRRAIAAASVRPEALSLPRMLETCTETVLALMNSCLPISPLERPSATSARISASRAVRVSEAGPSARDGRAALGAQPVQQRLGTEPVGDLAGLVAELARAGGVAGGAQDAGEDGADRGQLVDVAEVVEQQLGLAPHLDQGLLRRRVDAGQPAGAEGLGVEPLDPGPALGTPVAGRVGVLVEHGVALAVQALDLGQQVGPLGAR